MTACGPDPDNWPAGRPQIVDVNYVEQTSWNSNELIFELSFADSDGDIGQGRLEVSLETTAQSSIGLEEVFTGQVPALPLNANSGSFLVSLSIMGLSLGSGDSVHFEFALSDVSGETSNRASLALLTILKKDE